MNDKELMQHNMMLGVARMQAWWTNLMIAGVVPPLDVPRVDDILLVGRYQHTTDGECSGSGIVIKTWRN